MRHVLRALPLLAAVLLAAGCDAHKSYPVRSTPAGAEVVLDGKVMGVTPTALFLDSEKPEHLVILRRAGYTPVERHVMSKPLLEGPTRNCTVLACSPLCCFVPLSLCWERSFLPESLDVTLERDGQGLEVVCRPVGARVYVDGVLVAQTEPAREETVENGVRVSYPADYGTATVPLEPKVVTVEIRAEGYVTHESKVLIRPREYVHLRLDLLQKDVSPKP